LYNATYEYERAMVDSRNLIAIHKELNQGPGRRVREVSINRGVVVLTVAAWQAYVQDLIAEILEEIELPLGAEGYDRYRLIKIDAKRASHHFSTPNAENTRNLLMNVGFDPWPHWTWHAGPVHLTAGRARERLNQWLQVRHAIAHGDDDLPDAAVLSAVSGGKRSITRANAEACMAFFGRVVEATSAAARADFGDPEE
jgi:hypothetical protein